MRNPLLDLEFLRKLDLMRNKATYAKIILLTWNENPVYEIQGKITAGSINIDGASAVRRTCSLTMVSPDVDITNTYWALKNKFKLEVGVENEIDSQYPDIIWFKQGTYVFTSLNMKVQSNNFTISLNGKDKMCLLNGEVGGSINASTDFGKLEEYETLDNGEIVRNIIDIPIPDIIKNAIHAFAGEPLDNIVLNDIDNYGLELLEYRGDEDHPMYMPRRVDTGEISNMTTNGEHSGFKDENGKFIMLKSIPIYYDRTGQSSETPTEVYDDQGYKYNIIKIVYGETAGYRRTELIYPGELVAKVGESLTSVLDKIKNMFSDFEYFYDIDGRFVFQKKKTYINTSFNNLKTDENKIYAEDAMYTSSVAYTFENGILLSAFTDAPQILNIKNDFSIWGKRKGVGDVELPVHMRYAIDFKPTYYSPLKFNEQGEQVQSDKVYVSFEYREYEVVDLDENSFQSYVYYIRNLNGTYSLAESYKKDVVYYKAIEPKREEDEPELIYVDWRELIYQMALDYFKYNHIKSNFTQLIAAANPEYYPSGITGYETYYTDMQGFWRQLYFPGVKDQTFLTEREKREAARAILIEGGKKPSEITDKDIDNKIKNIEDIQSYYSKEYDANTCYNINISKYPETLNFWFDFMSVNGEFAKYAISAIGDRPKAINDDKVTGIYFQETPSVLFLTPDDYKDMMEHIEDYSDMTGYTFIQLTPSMENYFTISAQGKSAKDELDNLLYKHTYATENVNLTAVPIYYLQPNTRIFVKDDNTGINGEFIVSKITVPLQYNGTTAITTTRAVERIY